MINAIKRLFGKGGEVPTKAKPKSWKQQLFEDLQSWRGIGKTFEYLGRTMVVTGHYQSHFDGVGVSTSVGIHADYADDHGVIHGVVFSSAESVALMKSQP